jgi:CBS domain containing-hemolysin-like protein
MSRRSAVIVFLAALTAAAPAHASLFSGDTLDFVADIMAWVVLVIAPVIAIAVFWIVHILPEKIAENRHHPQAAAIKTLCLLSLFFGGMLWPIAWLWAYSRPVLYKLAYGTDTVKHGEEPQAAAAPDTEVVPSEAEPDVVAEPAPRATRTTARERRPWEA